MPKTVYKPYNKVPEKHRSNEPRRPVVWKVKCQDCRHVWTTQEDYLCFEEIGSNIVTPRELRKEDSPECEECDNTSEFFLVEQTVYE